MKARAKTAARKPSAVENRLSLIENELAIIRNNTDPGPQLPPQVAAEETSRAVGAFVNMIALRTVQVAMVAAVAILVLYCGMEKIHGEV